MNVIVRAPNWIGDAIMSFPFIKSLILEKNIDKVFIFARPNIASIYELLDEKKVSIISEIGKFAFLKNRKIIPKNIDIAFVLTPTFPATLPFFLRRIKNIYGLYSSENRIFLKNGINTKKRSFKKTHLLNSYLELLKLAGFKIKNRIPKLKINKEILNKFGLKENDYFVIAPGAKYGQTKRWSYKNYAILSQNIINKTKLRCIILGGSEDNEIARKISTIQPNILNLTGKTTIKDLFSVMAYSKFTVSNDSGLMHISYITGTKTYAIFGSTSPLWTEPIQNGTIFYSHRDCSPCFKRKCKYGHYGCLTDINPDEVFNKIIGDLK